MLTTSVFLSYTHMYQLLGLCGSAAWCSCIHGWSIYVWIFIGNHHHGTFTRWHWCGGLAFQAVDALSSSVSCVQPHGCA